MLEVGTVLLFQAIEVFVQAGTELFRQRFAGVPRGLGDAVVLANFLVIDAGADQRERGILRRATTATTTGIGAAATTPARLDPLGLQQKLNDFGLGGDVAGIPVSGLARIPVASSMTDATRLNKAISLANSTSPFSSSRMTCVTFSVRTFKTVLRFGELIRFFFVEVERIHACLACSGHARLLRGDWTSPRGSGALPGRPTAEGWPPCNRGNLPQQAGSTRSSAQRSKVSDQNSHCAIETPSSFFNSSPSWRKLPMGSLDLHLVEDGLEACRNWRRSK